MTHLIPAALAAALLLALQGCATLSQDECLAADWRTIGYEDGSRGYSPQRIGQHRKACAEVGVAPDLAAYGAGHDQGLTLYCTAARGFQVGRSGARHSGVCPPHLADGFLHGYDLGRDVHGIRGQAGELDRELGALGEEIEGLERDLLAKQQLVVAQSSGESLRRRLLGEIDAVQEAIAERRARIEQLANQKAALERRAAALEAAFR